MKLLHSFGWALLAFAVTAVLISVFAHPGDNEASGAAATCICLIVAVAVGFLTFR